MDLFTKFDDLKTLLLLFLTIFLMCATIFYQRVYERHPPGPWGLPFVGVIPRLYNGPNIEKTIYNWAERYGDIFSVRMGRYHAIFLNSPQIIREAFVKNQDLFSSRPVELRLPRKLIRNTGLLWHNGEEFINLRRFALTVLKDFGVGRSTLEETIRAEINITVDEIALIGGHAFCPKQLLRTAMLNIMSVIIFGSRLNDCDSNLLDELRDVKASYVKDVSWMIENYLPWLRYLGSSLIPTLQTRDEVIRKLVKIQILHHRKTYKDHVTRDFIDLHLKLEKEHTIHTETVSEENLVRAIEDMYMAGADVTAVQLLWAIHFMVTYPDVQDKCREEIHQVVGNDRAPSISDKMKLVYTEATVMEIQRMSSTVPFSLPHEINRDVTLHGYKLAKGSHVYANLYRCHMSPAFWKCPDAFLPDRWIDTSGNLIPREAFLPFCLGRRACLGESLAKMELFLFFTSLLQRFRFKRGRYRLETEGDQVMIRTPGQFLVKANPAEISAVNQ